MATLWIITDYYYAPTQAHIVGKRDDGPYSVDVL